MRSDNLPVRDQRNRQRLLPYLVDKLRACHIGYQIIYHFKSIVLAPHEREICHCVAADLRMGKGAAKALRDAFPLINKTTVKPKVGTCVVTKANGRTFLNLITKEQSRDKPTQTDFICALIDLRSYIIKHKIRSISITRLGCGLDHLNWLVDVIPILFRLFAQIPIQFNIYLI